MRSRVGDSGEVTERRSDGQIVRPPGRLAEIPAATFARSLRRPFPVQAEGLAAAVAGAVESDLLVRDLGGRAELAHAVRERDALNVLDVHQQRREVVTDLRPLLSGEVAGLCPIMGITHRFSFQGSGMLRRREPPQLLLRRL